MCRKECEIQVKEFSGAKFKGFETESEALKFMQKGDINSKCKSAKKPTQSGAEVGSAECGERAEKQVAASGSSRETRSGKHRSSQKQAARLKYSGNFMAKHCHR